jgi:GNAT superfamily N-acetyltransferase
MTVLIARNEAGLVLGTIGAAVRGVEGHIRGMAVLPSSQGAGLADRLLETIERELTRAGCSLVQIYFAPTTSQKCAASILDDQFEACRIHKGPEISVSRDKRSSAIDAALCDQCVA